MTTKANTTSTLFNNKAFLLILWVVFFCFAVSAALIFQKLLLPLMPSMLAPGSALTIDAAYFDSVALAMADEINKHGWSSWQLFPTASASGNVALLGALYALFGHDPTLAIPLNSAFHALGGVLIFMLAKEISPNMLVGKYAGIIAATLFVIFPSALNWYGQIHKDGYAIVGIFLVLLIWIRTFKDNNDFMSWMWLVVANFLAILLLASIRPYYLKLIFVVVFVALIVMLINRFIFHRKSPWLFFIIVLITLLPAQKFIASVGASEALIGDGYSKWQSKSTTQTWQWQSSKWIPDFLEAQIETVARTRMGLVEYGKSVGAKSIIDTEIAPESAIEVIKYIPRALQVALLAPFPTTWGEQLSFTRLVAIAEMLIIYLCLPGLFFLWRFHKPPPVVFAAYFALAFLTVYGVTIANIGTLYRVRYGFEFIMVLLGVIGWLTYLDKHGYLIRWINALKPPKIHPELLEAASFSTPTPLRKNVVGAGLIVMVLTFLGFLGFFVRDILMAHSFGLGARMDDFFLALMIPMFVVTVFCTPLGAAFIPFYTSIQKKSTLDSQLIQHLSAIIFGVLALLCLVLYIGAPFLLELLNLSGNRNGSSNVLDLMKPALLILWFSGTVILGNAALGVNQRLVFPSAAQMVVPVAAILALVFFGDQYGVIAVMIGMVIGQMINLLIIQLYLRKFGVSLFPKYQPQLTQSLTPLARQYLPLLAAAFFTGIALPIDTILAATLPEGNVSAFNLGTKIILFISGVVGAAISTVMLPYFSSLIEKRGVYMARKELSLFLLIATFLSVPASILMFLWAEPIVRVLFERGSFTNNDVATVTHIMQYALIQIPFFVCNILLLKFATATRHSITITVSALIGLVLNVAISLILMPRMGAAGIALAASISMLVSSALLVLSLVRYKHISGLDAITVLLAWVLFLTLLIAVHFQSTPSIVMTVITSFILLLCYFGLMDKTKETLVT